MRKVADRDIGWRQRQVVLSPHDQRAYSEHLRAAFPDLRFVDNPWPGRGDHPPELVVHESLEACLQKWVYLIPERDWAPTWRPDDDRTRWSLVDLPVPYGRIEKGGETGRWQDGPESMASTLVIMMIERDNKQDLSVARKVLRLLGKVVADGMLQRVAYPGMEPMGPPIPNKGWAGKDAYRWSLEAPDRILGHEGHKTVAFRAAG